MNKFGKIYLIPTTLGDSDPLAVLPLSVVNQIEKLQSFIVENEKTARRFIKRIHPKKSQQSLQIMVLDKYNKDANIKDYLDVCLKGDDVGVLSDAGVPAIADPGASIVKLAHRLKIQVVPLVGPSSILLAMMASGLNGQNFAFNGYLPIDNKEKVQVIKNLENKSVRLNQAQIFIETPYRNEKMLQSLLHILASSTQLCIATDITLNTEFITTMSIKEWKNKSLKIQKRPTIFIIQKD